MCGIVAGIGDGIKKEMITKGLKATQIRGRDATGIYQPKHGIVKAPLDAFEFIKTKEFEKDVKKDKMFIGHCRQWTSGKPEDNNNNHPFEGEKYILVHNGVVRMDKIEEYNYSGECDSEVLLSYLETKEMEEALKSVVGQAAIIFAPADRSYKMWLWRKTSPMEIAYSKASNTLLIASTESILRSMITKHELGGLIKDISGWVFSSVDEHVLWKVSLNEKGKIEAEYKGYFKPEYKPTTYSGYENVWQHGQRWSSLPETTNRNNRTEYWKDGREWNWKTGEWEKAAEARYKEIPHIKDDEDSTTKPSEVTTEQEIEDDEDIYCPPFGFCTSSRVCTKCSSHFSCKKDAEDEVEQLCLLTSDEIIELKGCNEFYSTSDPECRVCVLRGICCQEIVDNWDYEDIIDMQPATYDTNMIERWRDL